MVEAVLLPWEGKAHIPGPVQVSVKPMENKILFNILKIVLCENSLLSNSFFLTMEVNQKIGQAVKDTGFFMGLSYLKCSVSKKQRTAILTGYCLFHTQPPGIQANHTSSGPNTPFPQGLTCLQREGQKAVNSCSPSPRAFPTGEANPSALCPSAKSL